MLWSNQTQSARMAILYITAGALIDVWTATYYFLVLRPDAQANPDSVSNSSYFWLVGFFLTGLALLIIGILVGRIGQSAGRAEVAPAATNATPVAPLNPDLNVPGAVAVQTVVPNVAPRPPAPVA